MSLGNEGPPNTLKVVLKIGGDRTKSDKHVAPSSSPSTLKKDSENVITPSESSSAFSSQPSSTYISSSALELPETPIYQSNGNGAITLKNKLVIRTTSPHSIPSPVEPVTTPDALTSVGSRKIRIKSISAQTTQPSATPTKSSTPSTNVHLKSQDHLSHLSISSNIDLNIDANTPKSSTSNRRLRRSDSNLSSSYDECAPTGTHTPHVGSANGSRIHKRKKESYPDTDPASIPPTPRSSVTDEISLLTQTSQFSKSIKPKTTTFQPKKCVPLRKAINNALKKLIELDGYKFFYEPVRKEDAPEYYAIIKQPMDFLKMRKKLNEDQYPYWNLFTVDFELICQNCIQYNPPKSIYWTEAKNLLLEGRKYLKQQSMKINPGQLKAPTIGETNALTILPTTNSTTIASNVKDSGQRPSKPKSSFSFERPKRFYISSSELPLHLVSPPPPAHVLRVASSVSLLEEPLVNFNQSLSSLLVQRDLLKYSLHVISNNALPHIGKTCSNYIHLERGHYPLQSKVNTITSSTTIPFNHINDCQELSWLPLSSRNSSQLSPHQSSDQILDLKTPCDLRMFLEQPKANTNCQEVSCFDPVTYNKSKASAARIVKTMSQATQDQLQTLCITLLCRNEAQSNGSLNRSDKFASPSSSSHVLALDADPKYQVEIDHSVLLHDLKSTLADSGLDLSFLEPILNAKQLTHDQT